MLARVTRLSGKATQMYRHILIATDGSKPSERALSAGLSLAKHLGAEVSVIVVEAPFSETFDMPEGNQGEQRKQHAASVLRSAAKVGTQNGVACDCIQVGPTEVHDAIIANARERGCDLIVMGSRGTSGLSLELLGSDGFGRLLARPIMARGGSRMSRLGGRHLVDVPRCPYSLSTQVSIAERGDEGITSGRVDIRELHCARLPYVSDWDRLSEDDRTLYIAGAFDVLASVSDTGDKEGKRLMHYRNCIEINSITNRQLARNVHAYASSRPTEQRFSVPRILIRYLSEFCGLAP